MPLARPPPPRAGRALSRARRTVTATALPSIIDARANLLAATAGTARGGTAARGDRGLVEDALLALERAAEAAGGTTDTPPSERLQGRWRLVFTTALDVAPLLAASAAAESAADTLARAAPFLPRLPVPSVGDIYQQFGAPEDGRVANIIRVTAPPALDDVTLTVAASYTVSSPRRVRLTFRRASVRGALSSGAESLLAPALLPRGTLQMAALQAIKDGFSVPLTGELPAALAPLGQVAGAARAAAGGEYLISYVDESLLVGRQAGADGLFVFERVPSEEWAGGEDEGWE